MDESVAKMIANKTLATFRVMNWIGTHTKGKIAELIKISRPTLERRLNLNNWTYNEIVLINKHFPF